jgi:hypothetical protein
MRNTVSSSVVVVVFGVLLGVLPGVLPGGAAFAADGLQPRIDTSGWETLQGRLVLGTTPSNRTDASSPDGDVIKVSSLSLLGDYYLTRPLLGMAGGVRATSGVLLGQRSALWSSPPSGGAFSMDRRQGDGLADGATTPYLGVGYTGLSVNRTWGVSADFGLMALLPRSGVRLGRGSNSGQNLDDSVRELRLSPVLQVGVSYAF